MWSVAIVAIVCVTPAIHTLDICDVNGQTVVAGPTPTELTFSIAAACQVNLEAPPMFNVRVDVSDTDFASICSCGAIIIRPDGTNCLGIDARNAVDPLTYLDSSIRVLGSRCNFNLTYVAVPVNTDINSICSPIPNVTNVPLVLTSPGYPFLLPDFVSCSNDFINNPVPAVCEIRLNVTSCGGGNLEVLTDSGLLPLCESGPMVYDIDTGSRISLSTGIPSQNGFELEYSIPVVTEWSSWEKACTEVCPGEFQATCKRNRTCCAIDGFCCDELEQAKKVDCTGTCDACDCDEC